MIASGSYVTIRRPVSQPLVSSWKPTTIPYAAHHCRVASSLVRRTQRSRTVAAAIPRTAAAV
jgi:hypothetical protein